jgi:phosphoribosylaminoimidazolecarboxamide formyltransferase/IMP cyclohydrolase
MGIEILSTGGTAQLLHKNNVPVKTVDSHTGFPEIMDGRVKTLHPKIYGGILAVRDSAAHTQHMQDNAIEYIDLVVVNLYPFRETVAKPGVSVEEAVENIDIGGPAMLRSSAKNHAWVTVVVDPADYSFVLEQIKTSGGVALEQRRLFALKAFRHTADYDAAIDTYFSRVYCNEEVLRTAYYNGVKLRYGENPHQSACFYKKLGITEPSMASAVQLHGKELSFNNIVDGDAALEAVKELADAPAVAIIKHMNPCGYATGATLSDALTAAWSGDPVSAYGSVIALTRPMDLAAAQVLGGRFVEIIIAPDFDADALEYLKAKSSMIRLLKVGTLGGPIQEKTVLKHVIGGILQQDRDCGDYERWDTVTKSQFPEDKVRLARFAWKACKHVKSNAIVLAYEYQPGSYKLVGMGAGQPNRVDSLRKLCIPRATENFIAETGINETEALKVQFGNVVMSSDAFFPFSDNIDEANKAGIRYIVQPGGSKRDADVIDACDKYGISMVCTGMRHFRH